MVWFLSSEHYAVILSLLFTQVPSEREAPTAVFSRCNWKEDIMKNYLFVAAAVSALAMPAMADEVGVRAGPVGAGVTVGEGHRDYDRDRDRDRTTVIKEHEPRDRETVIKKEREDGVESKTTIHRDRD
jgi:hypothetical protein